MFIVQPNKYGNTHWVGLPEATQKFGRLLGVVAKRSVATGDSLNEY